MAADFQALFQNIPARLPLVHVFLRSRMNDEFRKRIGVVEFHEISSAVGGIFADSRLD